MKNTEYIPFIDSKFTEVLSVTEQLEMLLRLRIICERLNFAKAFLGNIDIIILNKKREASIDEGEFKQLDEQVKSDMSMYAVKDTRVDYIMDNPIWTSIGDVLINRFNDLERDTVKNGPISRKIEVINHYLTYVEKDDLDPLYELLQLLQLLEEYIDNYITCLNNDFYELIQKRHEFNMDIKTFSHNIIAINGGEENQESTWINAMLQLFDTPIYNKNTALLIEDVGSSIKDSFETDDLELVDIIKISRTLELILEHYNSLNNSIMPDKAEEMRREIKNNSKTQYNIDWGKRSCIINLNLLRNIIPDNKNDLEQFVSTLSPEEVSSIFQYADKIITSISRKRRKYKVKIII